MFKRKNTVQLEITYKELQMLRRYLVFVNRKVLQKGVKKVSTFNTQYACSDCMSRAPTLTFWCANGSSPFVSVLEPFCEGQVRETFAPFCSPFGAPKLFFKKRFAAGSWTA